MEVSRSSEEAQKRAPTPHDLLRVVAHGNRKGAPAVSDLRCVDVVRAVLGDPIRRAGQELFFHCPKTKNHKHGDHDPSFSVNECKNVWICRICGGGNAWQLAAFFADVSPDDKPAVVRWLENHGLSRPKSNLTLSAYAAEKKLPEGFLRTLGLEDDDFDGPAVRIPYWDA